MRASGVANCRRWACDVRLDAGAISVAWGWDYKEGRIPPKGRRTRRVPIHTTLREILVAELLRTGRREEELVFGSTERPRSRPRR
jgi:integrase